jgi:hypothetical protein
MEPSEPRPARSRRADYEQHWTSVAVPASLATATGGVLKEYQGPAWFRAAFRAPTDASVFPVTLELPQAPADIQVWINGKPLAAGPEAMPRRFPITAADVTLGDANLLVIRWPNCAGDSGLVAAPRLRSGQAKNRAGSGTPIAVGSAGDAGVGRAVDGTPPLSQPELAGRWQLRIGDDPSWANMPLPAKFGAATDIVFEPWIRR